MVVGVVLNPVRMSNLLFPPNRFGGHAKPVIESVPRMSCRHLVVSQFLGVPRVTQTYPELNSSPGGFGRGEAEATISNLSSPTHSWSETILSTCVPLVRGTFVFAVYH